MNLCGRLEPAKLMDGKELVFLPGDNLEADLLFP